ncbi:hypothetical protein [Ensifer adhaerens]|uniref:hypothetical protein n=1 Tax=Ensifer adhaerens TaxID=106592 RepID=UPI001568649A|nr:hypothetical protein [Ensifer adhaerens]
MNNAFAGIVWDQTCRDIELIGADFDGNCVDVASGSLSSMGEIRLLGASTRWKTIGGRAGYQGENGATPVRGLYINTGAADNFKFIVIRTPNGAIANGATGSTQTWLGVDGEPDRVSLSK